MKATDCGYRSLMVENQLDDGGNLLVSLSIMDDVRSIMIDRAQVKALRDHLSDILWEEQAYKPIGRK